MKFLWNFYRVNWGKQAYLLPSIVSQIHSCRAKPAKSWAVLDPKGHTRWGLSENMVDVVTTINHSFGNGSYQLSMVMTGGWFIVRSTTLLQNLLVNSNCCFPCNGFPWPCLVGQTRASRPIPPIPQSVSAAKRFSGSNCSSPSKTDLERSLIFLAGRCCQKLWLIIHHYRYHIGGNLGNSTNGPYFVVIP